MNAFTPQVKPTLLPGIYEHLPSGSMIRRNAWDVVASLHPEAPIHRPNGSLRRALARMARQRAAGGPLAAVDGGHDPISRTAAQLASCGLWDAWEVIAAPVHLIDHRLRVATTADLLLSGPSGPALALLATEPQPTAVPAAWYTQAGAAVVMASDQLRTLFGAVLILWACPTGVSITSLPVDSCTVSWVTALETTIWLDALRNGSEPVLNQAP